MSNKQWQFELNIFWYYKVSHFFLFKHYFFRGPAGSIAISQVQDPWFYPELRLLTVCQFLHIGFLLVVWFSPTSQNMPVSGLATLNCVNVALVRTGVSSKIDFNLILSVLGIGSGFTTTLNKINIYRRWINGFFPKRFFHKTVLHETS